MPRASSRSRGRQAALPGSARRGTPALATRSSAQGWGPQVGWDDRGDTYALDEQTCTQLDCYDGGLVNREFSPSEAGAFQLKDYAPGVGNARVGYGGPNEHEHEVLVLTQRVTLDADALAAVRDAALAQEADAYRLRPPLYGATAPAEQASGRPGGRTPSSRRRRRRPRSRPPRASRRDP